jgi:hypothetical protein
MRKSPIERLMSKVVKDDSGCWTWTGSLSCGYGQIMIKAIRKSPMKTHRVMWEFCNGPIPDGHELDHLCRNRACCNPKHLEPVQPRINTLRGESPAAKWAKRKTCSKGHRFTGTHRGYRRCLVCHREDARRRRAAQNGRSDHRGRTDKNRNQGTAQQEEKWNSQSTKR